MKSINMGELAAKVYELLKDLPIEDSSKVISATCALLGDASPITAAGPLMQPSAGGVRGPAAKIDAKTYFEQKQPKNKGEEFAVAARYREINGLGEDHSQSDLMNIILSAKRNFDKSNFNRDISNAQRQAQFFLITSGRGQYKLSHYGEKYVDALPDRALAKKLKDSIKTYSKKKKNEK